MIERLIKRMLAGVSILKVVKDLKNLVDGFAIEYYRWIDYKDLILSATVPNKQMAVDSINDWNSMFAIPNSLGGTDAEKIDRIIEASVLTGFPGPDWLEGQIRGLGFDLYVYENPISASEEIQYDDIQYAPDVQYAQTPRYLNPDDYPGELVVNDPPATGVDYAFTDDPARWGFYFWVSPFSDRPAANNGELLLVTADELQILKNLIIGSKLSRNWCVLQVKTS
jgi:hypothetical protein